MEMKIFIIRSRVKAEDIRHDPNIHTPIDFGPLKEQGLSADLWYITLKAIDEEYVRGVYGKYIVGVVY